MPDRTVVRPNLVEISRPEIRRPSVTPARPNGCRADELTSIERFLAERGVTRCPEVATTVPLVWDKKKRKWVRPPAVVAREASGPNPPPRPCHQPAPKNAPAETVATPL